MKRGALKKAVRIASGALVALLFALCLFTLIAAVIMKAKGGKNETWLFGIGLFQIVSGSMEPEIAVGDVVVGKRVKELSALSVGDDIVFRADGVLVTHRIVRIADGLITTKGLANDTEDASLPLDRVVAKRIFVLRGFGAFLNFIRSGYGFFLLVFAPLTLVVIFESVSLTRRLAEYRRERKAEQESALTGMREEIMKLREKLHGEPERERTEQEGPRESGEPDDE